jgi:hypothetical protein
MNTFVVYGSGRDHLDSLTKADAGDNGRLGWWTVDSRAQVGDRVIFYIRRPRPFGKFVAQGIVATMPEIRTENPWHGAVVADIEKVQVFSQFLDIAEARTAIPDWKWLKTPRATPIEGLAYGYLVPRKEWADSLIRLGKSKQ